MKWDFCPSANIQRELSRRFTLSRACRKAALRMRLDRTLLLKILKGVAIFAVAALVVAYVLDYAYFRVRMIHPKPAGPLETFTAPRLLAIAEKGGKVAYELDAQNPEQTLVCVHAWFPHGGYQPCWYLKPKSQQPIPM
jgi:hypothetical protein